jgi:hypothetical protein
MGGREYRLVIAGEVSDRVALAFSEMTVTSEGGETIVSGHVRDQAALQGLLQRISDLGLELLSVTAVDRDGDDTRSRAHVR